MFAVQKEAHRPELQLPLVEWCSQSYQQYHSPKIAPTIVKYYLVAGILLACWCCLVISELGT